MGFSLASAALFVFTDVEGNYQFVQWACHSIAFFASKLAALRASHQMKNMQEFSQDNPTAFLEILRRLDPHLYHRLERKSKELLRFVSGLPQVVPLQRQGAGSPPEPLCEGGSLVSHRREVLLTSACPSSWRSYFSFHPAPASSSGSRNVNRRSEEAFLRGRRS